MVFPANTATGVAIDIGEVVVQGAFSDSAEPENVSVTAQSGTLALLSQIGSAPSPLPSPLAPPPDVRGQPYGAAPLPTLAALTTYTVMLSHGHAKVDGPGCGDFEIDNRAVFTTR